MSGIWHVNPASLCVTENMTTKKGKNFTVGCSRSYWFQSKWL